MTTWFVYGPEAARWEFGLSGSAFWSHVSLVKEMHIWGDSSAPSLQPPEFPVLQRLVVHLKTSNGAVQITTGSETLDEDVIQWVRSSEDYTSFVKPCIDKERTFNISVVVVFYNVFADRDLTRKAVSRFSP